MARGRGYGRAGGGTGSAVGSSEVTQAEFDSLASSVDDKADASALTTEATTRGTADTNLGTRIDGVETAATALTTTVAGKQPLHANLTATAGVTSAANKMSYWTGSGTAAVTDVSPFARTLLDDTSAPAMVSTLGITADAPFTNQPSGGTSPKVYCVNAFPGFTGGVSDDSAAWQAAAAALKSDSVGGYLTWYGNTKVGGGGAQCELWHINPHLSFVVQGVTKAAKMTVNGTALGSSPFFLCNTDSDGQPSDHTSSGSDLMGDPRQPRHFFRGFKVVSSGGGGILSNCWATGYEIADIEAIDLTYLVKRVGTGGDFGDAWRFMNIKFVSSVADASICHALSGTGDGYKFENCSASGGRNAGGCYIAQLKDGHGHTFSNCVGGSITLEDVRATTVYSVYGDANSVYYDGGNDSDGQTAFTLVDSDVTFTQVNRYTQGNADISYAVAADNRIMATFEIADTASGTKGGRYTFNNCQPTANIRRSYTHHGRPSDLHITSVNPDSVIIWNAGHGEIWKPDSTISFAGYPVRFSAVPAAVATALSVGMDKLGDSWMLKKTQGTWLVQGIGLNGLTQSLRTMAVPTLTLNADTDYQTTHFTNGQTFFYRVWLERGGTVTEATTAGLSVTTTNVGTPSGGVSPIRLNLVATASTNNELPRCCIVVMRATNTGMTGSPNYVRLPWSGGDLVLYDVGTSCGGTLWTSGTPTGGVPLVNATWDGREDLRTLRKELFASAVPVLQVHATFRVGDVVWDTTPTAGGFMGTVCTVANTPGTNIGTWKTFGAISA